uniref:Transmembrane protein n=1 Tax=Medicago truncatula TaxID=3880 RepID=I3SM36_MEDTR|nr:unknown [Medicago truncatula]
MLKNIKHLQYILLMKEGMKDVTYRVFNVKVTIFLILQLVVLVILKPLSPKFTLFALLI